MGPGRYTTGPHLRTVEPDSGARVALPRIGRGEDQRAAAIDAIGARRSSLGAARGLLTRRRAAERVQLAHRVDRELGLTAKAHRDRRALPILETVRREGEHRAVVVHLTELRGRQQPIDSTARSLLRGADSSVGFALVDHDRRIARRRRHRRRTPSEDHERERHHTAGSIRAHASLAGRPVGRAGTLDARADRAQRSRLTHATFTGAVAVGFSTGLSFTVCVFARVTSETKKKVALWPLDSNMRGRVPAIRDRASFWIYWHFSDRDGPGKSRHRVGFGSIPDRSRGDRNLRSHRAA